MVPRPGHLLVGPGIRLRHRLGPLFAATVDQRNLLGHVVGGGPDRIAGIVLGHQHENGKRTGPIQRTVFVGDRNSENVAVGHRKPQW